MYKKKNITQMCVVDEKNTDVSRDRGRVNRERLDFLRFSGAASLRTNVCRPVSDIARKLRIEISRNLYRPIHYIALLTRIGRYLAYLYHFNSFIIFRAFITFIVSYTEEKSR